VKAESDILCTSRNAVKIVNSIPREQPVLFLPDRNLGNYVQRQTGRENMKIWQGACIVHATFPARRLLEARLEHPGAGGGASGMPRESCWRWRISSAPLRRLSTGAASPAREFIVMTESGIRYSLEKGAREALLFRGQRELQLQRVPVHEAEHARESCAMRC
jgi:quinolinate synthase